MNDNATHAEQASEPMLDQDEALAALRPIVADWLQAMADGLDHPDIWSRLRTSAEAHRPVLVLLSMVLQELTPPLRGARQLAALTLTQVIRFLAGEQMPALVRLEQLMSAHSQSPLVQGALFFCHGLRNPQDPRYELRGKVCPVPFLELDVLEGSSHLCCASWLPTSIGNLFEQSWEDVWNSPSAQDVRSSVLEGQFRHCNKITCPVIQNNELIPIDDSRLRQPTLTLDGSFEFLGVKDLALPTDAGWLAPVPARGPAVLNLSYDKTCNLSCPSCRTEKIVADSEERSRIGHMQDRAVKPMLSQARMAMITGSGDPFASKNFRQLLEWIGPHTTPSLQVKLMTNGVLLDQREWARLPDLQERIAEIKVSIDGASAVTHERLRRGSSWSRLQDNLRFMGTLRQRHPDLSLALAFVVQEENFLEMGEAVDLALAVGASSIHFARVTNWGTFSIDAYQGKAVFLSSHPRHAQFLEAMSDPRLRHPVVRLGDLTAFLPTEGGDTALQPPSVGLSPPANHSGPDPEALFPVANDSRVCFLKNAVKSPFIEIGDFTYYDDPEPPHEFATRNVLYHYPFIGDKLIIGKFCALARGVRFIMNGANHANARLTSYPFGFFRGGWETAQPAADLPDHYGRGDTVIGNDVWIGYEAMIMPGVKIGHGAVVGSRTVVTRDVPPYAVVAGNPGNIVRMRFAPDVIQHLLALAWWDWPVERITRHLPALMSGDIHRLLAAD
jgi:acetyltransferase-like isoleucine patch superfamily enzyme/MoaA/NifB/PqqE/SkfB family radical SAM enzyme